MTQEPWQPPQTETATPGEPGAPDVLQHDPAHTFTVIHTNAAPGTSGPPVVSQSKQGTAREALQWIMGELERL